VRSVIDEDGAVLLDLKEGKYFSLNRAATAIWLKLEAGGAIPEIEAHLVGMYDASLEAVHADLDTFLSRLKRERLLEADG